MNKYKKIFFPILSIVFALLLGLLLLVIKQDKLAIYKINDFLIGNFRSKNAFLDFLGYFSVYGLAGIAVAIGFKGGLFNIGVSGQMMFAGSMAYFALAWGKTAALNPFFILIICVLAATLMGLLTITLKVYGNIHEVVSTIMLNWAALYFYQFILDVSPQNWIEVDGASIEFPSNVLINWNIEGIVRSPFNAGIFITIILIGVFWFVFKYTKLGYQVKASGINAFAAKYAGINYNRTMIYTMLLSSAVAGVAGFVYYFGLTRYLPFSSLPLPIGFDGITISLLANNSFIGIIFSSLFVSAVYAQKVVMSGNKEVVETIIAISLMMIALSTYFLTRTRPKLKQWYLQIISKRKAMLVYSQHGFNRGWLKFLFWKDILRLQLYYFVNKIDIYYSLLELHVCNWIKFVFKQNKALYISKKLLINMQVKSSLIAFWKEHLDISAKTMEFNKLMLEGKNTKVKDAIMTKLVIKEEKNNTKVIQTISFNHDVIKQQYEKNINLIYEFTLIEHTKIDNKIEKISKSISEKNSKLYRLYYKNALQKLQLVKVALDDMLMSQKKSMDEVIRGITESA